MMPQRERTKLEDGHETSAPETKKPPRENRQRIGGSRHNGVSLLHAHAQPIHAWPAPS